MKRGTAYGVAVFAVALSLGSAAPLLSQQALFQGPAQGVSPPGQPVNTGAFPTMAPAPLEPKWRPPPHRIDLLPDPLGLRPPLAPIGANEQDDPAALLGPARVPGPPGLLRDFEGIQQTVYIPPDPIIAAGPGHLLALVNSDFAIFSKDGTRLQQIRAASWFGNVVSGAFAFDPKVLYDHFADRWVMVWLDASFDTLSRRSNILISVSDDSDPLGNWCNFALRGDVNGATPVDNWSDYQGVGFDDSAIYITPNQFNFSGGFAYVKLRVIPKTDLYDPACPPVTYTDFWDLRDPDVPDAQVFTVRPAVTFGLPGVQYLINDSPFTTGTTMTLWALTNPLDPAPTLTAANVAVTARRPPPDADQLGGTPPDLLIDVGGPRLRNAVYRDGSVWTAHSVADASGAYARARYVRIDVSGPTVLEDVAFGRDGCWLYYPAITADVNRNMVMVYNQSCTDEYIGIRYTGRRAADVELRPSATLKAGEANYVKDKGSGRNRWGDYSGIAVDPADPTRVWMFAEYAASPENTWGTWIGEVTARATGDVNDDGDVNVGDIVALVDFILERATPDPTTAAIADCNRDGTLNVGDVVCVVDLILGGQATSVAAAGAAATGPAVAARAANARLSLAETGDGSAYRTALLEAELGPGAAGLQARIAYDPARVTPGTPELGPGAAGFSLAAHDTGRELVVLLYSVSGATLPAGPAVRIRIPVRVGDASPDADLGLDLTRVLVAGRGGAVTDADVVSAELSVVPTAFRLSNPYPNPVGAGTGAKVELEIPSATGAAVSGAGGAAFNGAVRVVVDVYNVRGQRVRRLMEAELPPGRHTIEWDGRDDRGAYVGAGLYVLRVRAGSFAATRKLIVSGR
jgi:hypothetical protein